MTVWLLVLGNRRGMEWEWVLGVGGGGGLLDRGGGVWFVNMKAV